MDPHVPVEEVVRTLHGYVQDGLFDYIGLSECSAATLRRAHAVHPIAAVEIEVSPWSLEEETKKGQSLCDVCLFGVGVYECCLQLSLRRRSWTSL